MRLAVGVYSSYQLRVTRGVSKERISLHLLFQCYSSVTYSTRGNWAQQNPQTEESLKVGDQMVSRSH